MNTGIVNLTEACDKSEFMPLPENMPLSAPHYSSQPTPEFSGKPPIRVFSSKRPIPHAIRSTIETRPGSNPFLAPWKRQWIDSMEPASGDDRWRICAAMEFHIPGEVRLNRNGGPLRVRACSLSANFCPRGRRNSCLLQLNAEPEAKMSISERCRRSGVPSSARISRNPFGHP